MELSKLEILKREFDGEEGSFLILLRSELRWDWGAFYRMTDAMYHMSKKCEDNEEVNKELAHGFWFVDTWVKNWTSHPNFPKPEPEKHAQALELVHDLFYYFFLGVSPFEDDTLERLASGRSV